jgi:hypothetical protein
MDAKLKELLFLGKYPKIDGVKTHGGSFWIKINKANLIRLE